MKEVWHILEGSLATVVLTGSLGWLILGLCRIRLRAGERWPAALAVGVPLSAAAVWWAGPRKGALLWASILLTALATWRRKDIRVEADEPLPRWLMALMAVVMGVFGFWALTNGKTTPVVWDEALVQAIGIVRHWTPPGWDAGTFWTLPYRFGAEPAIRLVHLCFHAALALTVLAAARRWMEPLGAVTAALLVFTAAPLLGFAGFGGSQVLFAFCIFSTIWLVAAARQWLILPWAFFLAWFAWRVAPESGGNAFSGFLFLHLPWVLVPFAALALGWLVRRQKAVAAVLVGFQLVTVWPGLAERLAPVQELSRGVEDARMLERSVGPNAFFLSEIPLARSLMTHPVSGDPALLATMSRAFGTWRESRIPVPGGARRTYALPRQGVNGEVRFYRAGVEVPRSPAWRIRATEGEQRAGWAFDNSVVSGCDCAVEIDFGQPFEFDEVRVLGSYGRSVEPPAGLRRGAVIFLKRLGITHVVVREGSALADELHRNAAFWGAKETGQREEVHLFALE
ncbi:hypothetical protein [Paludibaculum fermentans]|uniref:Uncharacterized protein n=1 Tax=Paludibaculum fermentans TaxID=1473598 RepID=A0A7S7SIC3_PALFE|nr:hypothetical protein [Paludibaculum fermentans]QOY86872.1 hypothetical protein IRI77_29445 [Paludibaculum fermentans]